MSIKIKNVQIALSVLVILASAASAAVIGTWEGTPDGCVDWGNELSIDDESNMPSKYEYESTVGVTEGSQSLHINQAGWGQSLAFKLDETSIAEFMNNSLFSIDVTVPANDGTITDGYSQVYEVAMNAPGAGWQTVAGDTPLNFYWWEGSGQRTETLVIDYTNFRDAITATDYIEIIFTLNTGSGAPDDIYFDNAQLTGIATYQEEVLADNPVLYLQMETEEPINSDSGNEPMVDSSVNKYWTAARAATEFRANIGIGNCRFLPNDPQNAIAAANQAEDPGWSNAFGEEYAFAPDDITFEFWMNSEEMDAYGVFFHQVKTDLQKAPGMGNSDGTIRILNGVTTNDPNDESWWYTGVETPLDGQWHHMVVTYDEAYDSDPNQMGIQLYVDGALAGQTVTSGDIDGIGLGPELDHIIIGGVNDKGYTWSRYTGLVDEFAIYEGILNSDRIAAHYNAGIYALTPHNCEEVWEKGQGMAGDIDRDCDVDLDDFAAIASTWLLCNDPALFGSDPDCMASW